MAQEEVVPVLGDYMGPPRSPASPAVTASDEVRIRLITAVTIRRVQYLADHEMSVEPHVADSLVNHFRVAVRVGAND